MFMVRTDFFRSSKQSSDRAMKLWICDSTSDHGAFQGGFLVGLLSSSGDRAIRDWSNLGGGRRADDVSLSHRLVDVVVLLPASNFC